MAGFWSYSIHSFVHYTLSQVGSSTALSDADLNEKLRQGAQKYGRTLYVASGALWGGQDIQRMNDSGALNVRGDFLLLPRPPQWGNWLLFLVWLVSWFVC